MEDIAIDWDNDFEWFIAFVIEAQVRRFRVRFTEDDDEAIVRLARFGYDHPPNGNGMRWRLVEKNSGLTGENGRGAAGG